MTKKAKIWHATCAENGEKKSRFLNLNKELLSSFQNLKLLSMTALASQLRIFVSVFNLLSEVIVVVRFISVYIFLLPAGLSQILQNILTDKNNLFSRKVNPQATFNPDLVLVSFQTTQPVFLS